MSRSTRNSNPVTAKRGLSPNVVVTLVIVVVAALVLGGILLFSGGDDGEGGGTDQPRVSAELLRKPDSHTLTEAPDGKVTLVEFLDYQCPACASYYKNITSKIEQDYAGRITFVTRNFPLEMHPLAVPAAQAAEAAALQGKYQEMYHALYDNFQQWAITADGQNVNTDEAAAKNLFQGYATQLGLDVAKYQADLTSPPVQAAIDQGRADGQQAGVTSTPTLFVNGIKFEPKGDTFGAVDKELRDLLDKELG
ncbi:thioredoxin domain-containing protein [Amycolatopsis sp. 195334CR]|uniref:DsbA family protein n=1 Tax=Amycolatopsis sp. 195334CR TaxID=2814588 RepID=UPI001A8D7052|nr:thioredoxin domain-containing protein [Amycolatopsis sp. 195334CR]MBN6041929.1 thioredoxin domain-containing protein [Amycolatopsis sp. 195334CR]